MTQSIQITRKPYPTNEVTTSDWAADGEVFIQVAHVDAYEAWLGDETYQTKMTDAVDQFLDHTGADRDLVDITVQIRRGQPTGVVVYGDVPWSDQALRTLTRKVLKVAG